MQPSNPFSHEQDVSSRERLWQADPSDQTTLRQVILNRQRRGLVIPETLFHSLRISKRSFHSELPLQVGAMLADGSLARVGSTQENPQLTIPECRVWWVQPDEGCDLDALASLIRQEKIPGLALSGLNEGPRSFLSSFKDLRFLDLGELSKLFETPPPIDGIPQKALFHLTDLEGFQTLHYLNLERCDLQGTAVLEPLAKLTKLHHLNLSHNPQLTVELLRPLANLAELYSLDLAWNRLEVTEELSWFKELQEISVLSLIELQDRHGELRHIAELPKLKAFDLSNSVLLGQGLEAFRGHRVLTRLNLAYSFWDSDFSLFSTLPKLSELDLKCCDQVDDGALEMLADASSLTRLGFVRCQRLTDRGLKHLSKLKKLEDLDLENCSRITEQGLNFLANLPRLRRLSLACCSRIQDSTLRVIEDMEALEELDLTSCQLSKKAIEQLRESFEGRLNILEWR